MIRIYRWNQAGVEFVGSDASALTRDQESWHWIDISGAEPDTIRTIAQTFRLDTEAVEESLAQSHLPMVDEYLNEIFVVLQGFRSGEDGRLVLPETNVFIGHDFLITIHDTERASIEGVQDRLEQEGNLPVRSPADLLAFITLNAGRRYSALIHELERQIDSLEEISIQGDPQTVVEVHALRRDVIYLRRALGPQFDVIEDLSESTHPALDDEARLMFGRVASQHRRALEALESGRALLGSVLETYRGAVADQTNEIMRVLTVFSAILLPLTLIAGLWGMNFIRIPGADDADGFWILLVVMVVLAGGVWIYFARRGFIGAPRLRDLPKAVGLGIYSIGTAPIRAVSGGIKHLGRTEGDRS